MNLNRCFVLLLALVPLSTGASEYSSTADSSALLLSPTSNNGSSSFSGYGQAFEEVLCDQIGFTVRFIADGKDNADALENARAKMTITQEHVKAHGYTLFSAALTDIKLSRTTNNLDQRMSGYVQYEFVVEDFNDPLLLMSQVIGENVDQVSGLYYKLVDPSEAITRLKEQALDKATAVARARALKSGYKLGELIDVKFNEFKPGRSNHPMRKIQVSATARYKMSGQNQ